MTSQQAETPAVAAVEGEEEAVASVAASSGHPNPLPKIDPITAVQDSIDSLALSLFEALRGVRDAVAPESLAVPGTRPAATPTVVASAFTEPNEEMEKDASAKDRLLNGVNLDYFRCGDAGGSRAAFDLLEPDYESFIMSYLGDNPYAKQLIQNLSNLNEASKLDEPKPKAPDVSVASPSEAPVSPPKPKVGDVGYQFRKKFDSGWYTGKVVEIRPLAANGYDRRCVYNDGDIEDLRLEDLQKLEKLDPANKKPRLSIKVNPPKAKSGRINPAAVKFPLTQTEYTKLLLDSEHRRDVQTTQDLAQDILAKSAEVDDLVARLPGMGRTRRAQMERIEELIRSNHEVTQELEEAYAVARERRELVRVALGECTCSALGIEEDV